MWIGGVNVSLKVDRKLAQFFSKFHTRTTRLHQEDLRRT